MVESITIREMNDYRGAIIVEELTKKIFPVYLRWSYTSVITYINMGSKVFVASDITGKTIGFAFVRKLGDNLWEITLIGIVPEFRGRGIGKALLKEVLKSVKGEIYLHVKTNNLVAISMYESMGFTKRKTLKGFYSDGSDAYLMSCSTL